MTLNKIKYLGICATSLLTVAPLATSMVSVFAQPTTVVKAETTDPAYQKSLDEGFSNNTQITVDQLQKLEDYDFGANFNAQGTITLYNVYNSSKGHNNALFSGAGDSDKNLSNMLNVHLFNFLANPLAKVGSLAKEDYATAVQFKGDKLSGASSPVELSKKLRALTDGDSFLVTLTTTNSAGNVVGVKSINVKVFNRANMKIQKLAPVYVKPGTQTTTYIDEKQLAPKILDGAGNPAFPESRIIPNGVRYGLEGATKYVSAFDMPTYELKAGSKSTTYNQLIEMSIDTGNSIRYADNNYVFLRSGNVDASGTATTAATGTALKGYIVQPVIVTSDGKPVDAPASTTAPTATVPADFNVNSKTTKSIDPMKGVSATYVDKSGKTQTLAVANIKVTAKDAKNADVKMNADGSLPTTTDGTYTLTYVFTNPDDATKTTTKTVTVTVAATDVTVGAPTVNNFVEGTYTLSNVKNKSISPFNATMKTDKIDASYTDKDGKVQKIDNTKVKVAVVDASNKAVALNSDGTIPMTTVGTYKVTYTFANGDDATKTTVKTINLTVNSATTDVPKATYYQGASQNEEVLLSENETAMIVPLNGLLLFKYTYTDAGSSTPITDDVPKEWISVSVTKDGQPVKTNTVGDFKPEAGIYKVEYTVVNPKDNSFVLHHTRTYTIKAAKIPTVTNESGVVYINYVPGYGVNLWKNNNTTDGAEQLADGTNRKLAHGSAWKYDQVATYADGKTWYRLGTNQWVQGEYASKTPVDNPNDWKITEQAGVGKVYFTPGYSVNVWTSPDAKTWTKKIPDGSSWKYFKVAHKPGKMMYNLGGDQWVDAAYFK
ncbi:hypothetical protein [Xylocopilactobacillus apicola]|uniref:Uncharacterized protein n=1 Tax=Xylocopilactobacillus apicola TaxID=2932184 RepID=A0AAU9DU44_9LACO|nr:hypothetical protein [Xylocopilactobacillus apicola]BDR58988.1 hypothetical protein XA3_14290 [Xylocopilactobacillus apicola]